jgi:maltose-binding protein MalE
LVVDLSGLVSQELAGSFNPAALDPMKHQQALIGLPYALQGVVLYRNKAIVPEPAATWGALVEKAKESTQGDQVGAVLERSFFFSGGHLPGIGGQLMQPDGGPAFNDEKGLAWVELLRSFEQAGPAEYLSDRDLEMFKEGRVGWIIDGTWNMSSLAEAIGEENLAIDPWPAYSEGGLSGFVQAEDAYLSSRVPENDLEATWKFIEFLASSAGQAHLAEAGFIPAIDGSRGELTVDNPLLGQAISALAGGTAYPVRPEMAVYTVPLDVALRSIFEVNKGPEDALQTASDEIQAAIDALRATPTPVATQTP